MDVAEEMEEVSCALHGPIVEYARTAHSASFDILDHQVEVVVDVVAVAVAVPQAVDVAAVAVVEDRVLALRLAGRATDLVMVFATSGRQQELAGWVTVVGSDTLQVAQAVVPAEPLPNTSPTKRIW